MKLVGMLEYLDAILKTLKVAYDMLRDFNQSGWYCFKLCKPGICCYQSSSKHFCSRQDIGVCQRKLPPVNTLQASCNVRKPFIQRQYCDFRVSDGCVPNFSSFSTEFLTRFTIEFCNVDFTRIALCLTRHDLFEKTLDTIIFSEIEEEWAYVEDKPILLQMLPSSFPPEAL